jgi:GNAT superfamily N-acetyltransferase
LRAIEVVPADRGKCFKEFVELPYNLYRDNPYWVAPLRIAVRELLDRQKHPFWAHADGAFFLALVDGEPAGRIAAILDRKNNEFHSENAVFFGFFESINDKRVAQALLDSARQWARERGATVLRGPVNPSTNYECGLLVDGFDLSPIVMMPYNFDYYPELIEAAGFAKAKDLYAYAIPTDKFHTGKIERVARRVLAASGITIRPIDQTKFQQEVESVWEVYNAAWERNWGFIPMSRDEFMLMGKEMKQILKPELILMGEVKGKLVGFGLALPDINHALKHARGKLFPTGLLKILYYQRSIKTVRVLALGVVEEYRTSGVAAALYAELVRNGQKLGFEECEMSWILEDNILMNRSLALMGGKRYKTYRIYESN